MQRKIDKLKAAAASGDWTGALRIAAKFQELGEHERAIRRAHQATWNPSWSRQIGRDPEADIRAGIEALKRRYGLTEPASKNPNEGNPKMTIYRDVSINPLPGYPGALTFDIGRHGYSADNLPEARRLIDETLSRSFTHRDVRVTPGADDGEDGRHQGEFEVAGNFYTVAAETFDLLKFAAVAIIDGALALAA